MAFLALLAVILFAAPSALAGGSPCFGRCFCDGFVTKCAGFPDFTGVSEDSWARGSVFYIDFNGISCSNAKHLIGDLSKNLFGIQKVIISDCKGCVASRTGMDGFEFEIEFEDTVPVCETRGKV